MNFDDVVEYIKLEGCRVRIYSSEYVCGGNAGTFNYAYNGGPLINIATKGTPRKKIMETLLHEFGHYLQWKDGFMQYLDGVCDAYDTQDQWLDNKIELTDFEIKCARNIMLSMEYDAEQRGARQGLLLKPNGFCVKHYLRGAASYMEAIKWSFARRKSFIKCPSRRKYKGEFWTHERLFSPLEEKRLKQLDGEMLARNSTRTRLGLVKSK